MCKIQWIKSKKQREPMRAELVVTKQTKDAKTIKEMKIKTTRYHFTPIRMMAIINKTKQDNKC